MTGTTSLRWRIAALMLCQWTTMASESVATSGVSVIELGINNFTRQLSMPDMSDGHCLIEFYAHWCPHCIHYKPLFEKVGRFFNGEPRPQPHVWVLRIDCAAKPNAPVCDKYKVTGYPTIYLGKAQEFIEEQTVKLIKVPPLKPGKLVEFLNPKLEAHYVFEEKESLLHIQPIIGKRKEHAMHADMDDIERATVELFGHLFESTVILTSTRIRNAFIDWVRLLAMAHPSQRCRSGSRYLVKNIGVLWPEGNEHPSSLLSRLKICSVNYNEKEWGSCAPSIPEARGFTCGLWQLLHSLSVGIDETAADEWMKGTQAFAQYFFGCAECAKHFYAILTKEDAMAVKTRTELVMWLWSTHNSVNARIAREELQSGSGDPSFPKIQWPPSHLCPPCHKGPSPQGIQWSDQSVREFLIRFYSAVYEPELESRTGRKELIAGTKEFVSTDVFSKEDATVIELKNAGSSRMRVYVLIAVMIIIILIARKQRRRKIFPRRKDLL